MIVRLTAAAAPWIDDCSRLDRLHASAAGPLADMELDPICRIADEDHVWVSVDAIPGACAIGTEAYDALIAYAAAHGWLDPRGEFVRAHLEIGE